MNYFIFKDYLSFQWGLSFDQLVLQILQSEEKNSARSLEKEMSFFKMTQGILAQVETFSPPCIIFCIHEAPEMFSFKELLRR